MHDTNERQRLAVSAHLVDGRGLACPAPIIELAKALHAHGLVELWADDPAAGPDVRAFVEATGHALEALEDGPPLRAVLRRRVGR